MKKITKVLSLTLLTIVLLTAIPVITAGVTFAAEPEASVISEAASENALLGSKAMAAGIAIAVAAGLGAIGMGIVVAKALDGMARQPEAEGKLRTTMMLGLVFVETAIIYALIVAILIIFVL